jgi:hypothetical protein
MLQQLRQSRFFNDYSIKRDHYMHASMVSLRYLTSSVDHCEGFVHQHRTACWAVTVPNEDDAADNMAAAAAAAADVDVIWEPPTYMCCMSMPETPLLPIMAAFGLVSPSITPPPPGTTS